MKSKLRVISGKGSGKLAPRPKSGLTRAVYDTIEALGGATVGQIKQYLPAAIDKANQVCTRVQLGRCLYNGQYRGYWVHDPKKDHYKIAAIEYYDARQAVIEEIESRRGSKGFDDREGTPRYVFPTIERPKGGWLVMGCFGAVCFMLGVAVGIAV